MRRPYNETYDELRKRCISVKCGAVDTAKDELIGLINWGGIAEDYFGKDEAWIKDKFMNCTLLRVQEGFSEEEYAQFSNALRDIARRLVSHADEIDNAYLNFEDNPLL